MNSEPGEPENERRPDKAALVFAAALAAVAIVMFWSTAQMGGAASYSRVGPAVFPYAIATVFVGLAIWTAIAAWRGDFPERETDNVPPMLWIIGGLIAQMFLLHAVGFSIATGLLFAATAKGFGKGPLWKTFPIGVVLSLAIWYLFSKGLQLSLPTGPLESLL